MALPDPNSYESIGRLITAAAAAVAMINQGHAFVGRVTGKENERTISPSPLTVRGEKEFVTKEEFEAFTAEIKGDYAKLQDSLTAFDKSLRGEMKEDATLLHEKINAFGQALARVESSDHEKSNLMRQMHEDIRTFLVRAVKP